MGSSGTELLLSIAVQFMGSSQILAVKPLGNGNINDTFLVITTDHQFVLQKINTQVFQQPQLVMQNMRVLTEHIHAKLQARSIAADRRRDRRWETPRVLLTQDQGDHWCGDDGAFWRAISFIADSEALDRIQDVTHATEVGYALGTFHHLISDLAPEKLADTLPGFHITPQYLQQYIPVNQASHVSNTPEVNYCRQFVADRASWAHVLEHAKASGKLPLRLMHGDPKVNNVMLDRATQQAIAMVDLDTVKPGLVHYDIGDCLRSGCNPMGEETQDWQAVQFELELCRGTLQGYLAMVSSFMTANDYAYIFDAVRLISFELGLRFFTDYLAGDVYFKVKYPEHNLVRALVQFKLTESIEAQETSIRTLVRDFQCP
jgi:Phosphotransferase enzyme family